MAKFFKNPKELSSWIRDKSSADEAFQDLMQAVKLSSQEEKIEQDELDIKEACISVYKDDDDASETLYNILSRHKITEVEENLKKGYEMEKKAQVSKQRNDWMRGERNKWNRSVDGHKEQTPWRIDRDQFFDFTHYTTDALSFDEDPSRVYSGEAIWRMYVMDKFYREYQTDDGKWVGGYINDRFHVFPTAGTPSNPDSPRDGGNQMELGLSERTRKPRPHQYSTERRLEEARGNKTYDLEVTTTAKSFNKIVKTSGKVPVSRNSDSVYNIFRDCLEMKEAGINYADILEKVADHYGSTITNVAQIAQFAENMVKKHNNIAYAFEVGKMQVKADKRETFRAVGDLVGQTMDQKSGSPTPVNIMKGTVLVRTSPNLYEISSGKGIGTKVMIEKDISGLIDPLDGHEDNIQDAADEVGLNEVGDKLNSNIDVNEVVDENLDSFNIDEV